MVTNLELVKKQNLGASPINQDFIDNPKTSTHYHSGREIKLGDKVCFAFFHDGELKNLKSDTDDVSLDNMYYPTDTGLTIKFITFHPEEYGQIYEDVQEGAISDKFPSLKYKK